MSESEKTETPENQSPSEDDKVTIVVTDAPEEEEQTTQVTKSSDPIWKEIRGVRKQLALLNRRQAKKAPQAISVESNITEVTDNARLTEHPVHTESGAVTVQEKVVSQVKRTNHFNSLFRKWR